MIGSKKMYRFRIEKKRKRCWDSQKRRYVDRAGKYPSQKEMCLHLA